MTQVNEIDFVWDEWEGEFRGIVDRMTDDEWGNLDDNLRRMEEQEEGIFAEIKKHSEDTIVGSEMINNKGKIVEEELCSIDESNVTDDSEIQITPKLTKESSQLDNEMMKYFVTVQNWV